jgi:hypothetical protein
MMVFLRGVEDCYRKAVLRRVGAFGNNLRGVGARRETALNGRHTDRRQRLRLVLDAAQLSSEFRLNTVRNCPGTSVG